MIWKGYYLPHMRSIIKDVWTSGRFNSNNMKFVLAKRVFVN